MCASAARPDHLQLLDVLLGFAGDDDSPLRDHDSRIAEVSHSSLSER